MWRSHFVFGQQLKICDLPQERLELLQAVVVNRENIITIYYTGLAPTRETKNRVVNQAVILA
ncbi:MAG: hypothetical protein N2645_12855 [Clostridia bacterium]|nr:hypothetical protein [Clostridia bacterium]